MDGVRDHRDGQVLTDHSNRSGRGGLDFPKRRVGGLRERRHRWDKTRAPGENGSPRRERVPPERTGDTEG